MSNIKAVVETSGETCDFYLPQSASMDDLLNTLMAMLDMEPGFKIKYRDEDGDVVTMSTTEELREVMRAIPNLKLELSNCRKFVRASSSSVAVQAKAETVTAATATATQQPALSDYEAKRLVLHTAMLCTYLGLEVPDTLQESPRDESKALIEEAAALYGRLLATVHVESHATSHIARGVTVALARHGAALPQDFASSLDAALSAAVSSSSRTSTDDSHHFRLHETESTVLIDPKVTFQPQPVLPSAAAAQPDVPAQEEQGHSETNVRLEVEVQSDDFVLVSNSTEDVHHQQQQQQQTSPPVPVVDARVVSEFDPLSTPAAAPAPVVVSAPAPTVPAASSSSSSSSSSSAILPAEIVAPAAIKQDLQMIDIPNIEYPTVPVPAPVVSSYNPFSNPAPQPQGQPQSQPSPSWSQDNYNPPSRTLYPPSSDYNAPARNSHSVPDYTSPPRSDTYPSSGSFGAPTPFDYPPAVPSTFQAPIHQVHQAPAEPRPASETQPSAERWTAQLLELNNMGFGDNEKNISALESFNGDINTVVASLVSDM